MTTNSNIIMSNSSNNNSQQQQQQVGEVTEVVCTPTFLLPFSSGLDAKQTLSGFVTQVTQVPVNNQTATAQQQPLIKFTSLDKRTQQQKIKNDSSTQTAQLVTSSITPTLTNHTITIQHQPIQSNHLNMQNGQANKFSSTAIMIPTIPTNSGHMKANHHFNSNGDVVWSCPSCKLTCKTATELQNHLSIHTKTEKTVPCEQCGKLFASQERVKIHVKVAHGNKSAVCPICSSSFSYKCKLADHMRTHTGEKPYECEICGRRFSQKNHVRRHKMIHTGEKPHCCSICGKGFYRKDKLSRHRLIHLNPSSRKSKQNQSNQTNSMNNSSLNLNAVSNGTLLTGDVLVNNSIFQTTANSTGNDNLLNTNNGTIQSTIQLIPVHLYQNLNSNLNNNLNGNMNQDQDAMNNANCS